MTNRIIKEKTNLKKENRQWWVENWLELLNSYRFKKRLERARNYAREGNVLNIDFKGTKVLARVQGTEKEPYKVSLYLDSFSNTDWNHVIETMSEKALFSAQLLAGEMPENIEEVFTANGLSLFPFSLSEIRSRCTCPDKANPCKHIGAVYYQLGDRFSEDPFILFQLRGRTKIEILQKLREVRSKKSKNIENISDEDLQTIPQDEAQNQSSLELDTLNNENKLNPNALNKDKIQGFWEYQEPLESSLVVISPPPESKTILDVLGNIPLNYDDAMILKQYLKQIYKTIPQQAVIKALKREE